MPAYQAPDQHLFALYLPGAELTLHAAVHSASESERAMLANALDKLDPDDVLLLDRGYPAAWLVNLLDTRGLRFVIRCDTTSGGWRSLRQFIRSDLHDATISLKPPTARDVADWGCLQRTLPRLLLDADITALFGDTPTMIARSLRRSQPDRSSPRPDVRSKPHPNMAHKG